MKLLVAIVQDQDVGPLLDRLAKEGHRATRLASTGGFLRQGNTTLLLGVEDREIEQVVEVVRCVCQPRAQVIPPSAEGAGLGRPLPTFIMPSVEVTVGGATIFILEVDDFFQI